MSRKQKKTTQAAIIALIGGLFILGLSVTPAEGVSWHWPMRQLSAHKEIKDFEAPKLQVFDPKLETPKETITESGIKVPVLMYHHVADMTWTERQRDAMASDLTVSIFDFESQVKYFSDEGYRSITVQQLYEALTNGVPLPSKPVIFTFDDGYKDVFANAVPILKKYGFTGSFAIATDLLGRPSYAVWEDVVEADRASMEILSHTENHLDLTSSKYSDNDIKREITQSKTKLSANLGHDVNFFVYPYGHANDHLGELLVQAGYQMAFTTEYGIGQSPKRMLEQPRVRVHGVDGLAKLKKVLSK